MNATNNSNIPAEQDILDGLAVNLKLSQDLLAALQEESTALRGMDTQNLFRISRQKDTLLAKIQYLDNSLRTSLATDNKSAPAPKLTPEQLRTVGQYKTRINTMRQEIISRNTINKRLTEDTLGYLSDAIALISNSAQPENVYSIPGRSQARSKNLPNFISREV